MREQFHARRDKFIAGSSNIKGLSCLPARRILCVQRAEDWLDIQEAGRSAAEPGWRGVSFQCSVQPGQQGYLPSSIANSMENLDAKRSTTLATGPTEESLAPCFHADPGIMRQQRGIGQVPSSFLRCQELRSAVNRKVRVIGFKRGSCCRGDLNGLPS
jgi:hypothetical protein